MVLAIVLLASDGIVVRSFLNVYSADVGADTANVLVISLGLHPERYPGPETWISFYRDLDARLLALPGVQSIALGGTRADLSCDAAHL
jgi:hypothetical protein